jgi:hypothetical protein
MVKTLFMQFMEKRQEKKRLMAQPEAQPIWDRSHEPSQGRQMTGTKPAVRYEKKSAAWVDEKQDFRLRDEQIQRGSCRIEVEGPPTYGEVMKGT